MSCLSIVVDLERSETFYREILGFERSGEMEPGIIMKAGEVLIYLEVGLLPELVNTSSLLGFMPCFKTDSLRDSYEALKAAGIPMVSEYQEFSPEFALFTIADPDGHRIEFAGRP
jgi:catechol 2,3-dioxygenase-like lactoylglutathione lyase family enzyme